MRGGATIVRLGNLVIGFILAIIVAYLHDASVAPLSPDGHPQNLVNWEVFGRTVGETGAWLRDQGDRLMEQIHPRN